MPLRAFVLFGLFDPTAGDGAALRFRFNALAGICAFWTLKSRGYRRGRCTAFVLMPLRAFVLFGHPNDPNFRSLVFKF